MSEFDELISMLHLPSEYKQQLDVAAMIKVGMRARSGAAAMASNSEFVRFEVAASVAEHIGSSIKSRKTKRWEISRQNCKYTFRFAAIFTLNGVLGTLRNPSITFGFPRSPFYLVFTISKPIFSGPSKKTLFSNINYIKGDERLPLFHAYI